ncbi:endonuclease domain-containing protein [Homoserinibacter sp. YIM 151385]|uniref:endonuclease domain-containing protein n=1 Tax=Homoserinibacter sp. YIM 151385 TaxID=2985506 RepID=UPI0022F0818A|nr:DUF559 domain-containing protein [Homoserinibacter sp. YIM 151385]WBU38905.1 DUF559 domain-containing protein [Homoserinibacter sp. YIM 151385]
MVHWSGSTTRGIQSVPDCLVSMASCAPKADFFAAMESAILSRVLPASARADVVSRIPGRLRRVAIRTGAESESGTESLLKLAMIERRIPFRQQVPIDGVGRVDFVIGERLIVEADSREYHSDAYRDRRRDAEASIAGYRTLRFMYGQVVHELSHCLMALEASIARGDHRA